MAEITGDPITLDEWKFHNFHLHKAVNAGKFVSAESTLIAAGSPLLGGADTEIAGPGSASGTTSVFPIGLLEQFSLNQSKQLQRIFEIGSARSYFVPGRVIGSVSLGRTFYHGPSLMKIMYSDYWEDTGSGAYTASRAPGGDNFWIDLGSDFFAQPFGMAVYFKDAEETDVGAFYLENAYIQGHSMTISSGSVLIMEGVSMQYDILRPINMTDGGTDANTSEESEATEEEE